ncbi:MAG: hypothetical protein ABR567_15425 [Myxococcales bacterium]|nr:hypothetical protein [Myxococcales bacterium]
MRFPVTLKKLIDGKLQARCIGTVAGELTVVGNSREEVLERARNEIRYRIELCPCSTVADDFVELDVLDAAPSGWRGSVF